jgi:hypothetical protein
MKAQLAHRGYDLISPVVSPFFRFSARRRPRNGCRRQLCQNGSQEAVVEDGSEFRRQQAGLLRERVLLDWVMARTLV